MTAKAYTIHELSEAAGLPRRTIYFYTQQGLLPSPHGAGVSAYYDDAHLLRLKLIPLLRRQGRRLDDIRQQLTDSAPGQLETLLDELTRQTPPPTSRVPTAQAFTHYALPDGLILIVPGDLTPAQRRRVHLLLNAAQDIYGPPEAEQRTPPPGIHFPHEES